MALPNLSINPYVKRYVGGVSQEYTSTLANRQQEYQSNIEQDDILGYQMDNLKNAILPKDRDYADILLDQHRKSLAERAKQGNYEDMNRDVRRAARNYASAITPLTQRAQDRAEYIKNLHANKDIGEQTKQLALAYSDQGNKAYNPVENNNRWSGFNPAKDQSPNDLLKKWFGDNYKADKSVSWTNPFTGEKQITTLETNMAPAYYLDARGNKKFIYYDDNTGETSNVKSETNREINQIELAARQGLAGNKEYQDYLKTQVELGNHRGVLNEENSAIKGEMNRLGYVSNDIDWKFTPADLLKYREEEKLKNSPLYPVLNVGQENKFVNDSFQNFKNGKSGFIGKDTNYAEFDPSTGNYTEFFDKDGNKIPREEALLKEFNWSKLAGEGAVGMPEYLKKNPIERKVISKEKAEELRNEQEGQFQELLKDTWLAKGEAVGVVQPNKGESIQHYEQRTKDLANTPMAKAIWNSPEFRKKVLEGVKRDYEAIKTVDGRSYAFANAKGGQETFGEIKPNGEGDNSFFTQTIDGRIVRPTVNNKQGILTPQELKGDNSWNAILKKMDEKGYKFVGTSGGKVNPANPSINEPAINKVMHFEAKDKDASNKPPVNLEVAIGFTDADNIPRLRLLNAIGKQKLSGNSGIINIDRYIPNGSGHIFIRNRSNTSLGIPNAGFTTDVMVYDKNGQLLSNNPYDYYENAIMNTPELKAELNPYRVISKP